MPELIVNSGGVGDVLNPTAGTQLDCGLFAFGVLKPECWCLSFPSLCPSSTLAAAQGIAYPELNYNISPPPAVQAIPAGYEKALPSVADAQAQTDAAIAAQGEAMKAEAAAAINSSTAGQQPPQPSPDPNACSLMGISCTTFAIGAAAFFVTLILVKKL